eukprot:CAMPEP_0194027730 /NCGR_PEP_ID=MMETSP0009_2-20130614/1815_1 /TAXON_ID=210454 /ORGANISM="Grammatophora oceanica, Strain CCMP 410" /LENGTH=580 /DNA_ID=CAMNT_0038666887 /DNA_START=599 /DNA_END=2341 /DNA_ORIENTATION=+
MTTDNVQQPLFAPVSQGAQMGDDIDLNEIFADYFINEFEDPLNAYTSSMANYSGAAAAVALAQKQQQTNNNGIAPAPAQVAAPVAVAPAPTPTVMAPGTVTVAQVPSAAGAVPSPLVPTRIVPTQQAVTVTVQPMITAPTASGIKTPYHAGVVRAPAAPLIQVQGHPGTYVTTAPAPVMQIATAPGALAPAPVMHVAAPTATMQPATAHVLGGANGATHPGEPATKKAKQQVLAAPATVIVQHQAQVPNNVSKGGLSGRLGFQMVGGQLAVPQPNAPKPVAAVAPAVAHAKATGVALPVGVGIRLGGVGGVAPATAANAARPGQFMMWAGQQPVGGMSEQAIAERRQRNREHAKRSRVRKKFMLESLQEQVRALQKDNVELRMIIQEKIPNSAQKIISECCSQNPLFSDEGFMNPGQAKSGDKEGKKEASLVKSDFSLMESLTSGQQNFVLSDPRLPDNPIVYASPGFYTLTGYTQEQVLGRNCRFLQGPGTDPRAVDIIRTSIANGSDATTCILNYKADGTPFWNQFFVAALRDSDNCIVNYVGVQCEVEPEAGSSALEDKVNSVLPLQNKGEEEGEKK